MNRLLLLSLAALLLLSLPLSALPEETSPLCVRKVENMPEDFILGMDVSSVIAEENSGVVYYGFDGQPADLFDILTTAGINTVRVRIWNHPFDAEGHGYGGGNCDIENACRIAERAASRGLRVLVDFHYSDFWADPGKQMVPLAWRDMEIEEKTEALYTFTRDCLLRLKETGAEIVLVQVGNETNGKLCGEKTWFNIQYLLQAGARATREVFPEALVAVHFANPENAESYETYARKLDYYQVDYDVFATSWYPYWHGSLDNLSVVLTSVSQTYGKKVMVVETSYAWTAEDSDFSPNTVGDGDGIEKPWPFTPQGQANAVRAVTDTVVNQIPAGIGVVYWEGAWISVGTESREQNQALWEQYGSGWASSHAASYDPDDAGKYYGGCAVDNQAFFDPQGHPLESLKVFRLMRTGNEGIVRADALEEPEILCDLNAPLNLPETVNAVMTDGSLVGVPVTWDLTPEREQAMRSAGPAEYVVTGEAGGMPARCRVSMVEYNYLENYSFESGQEPWIVRDLRHADELYVEEKRSDSLTGIRHLHFWSAAENSVEFTAEQTVTDLPAGRYRFSVSIMGGDSGESEVYAYVKVNGETAGTAPMTITSFGSWDTGVVPNFSVPAGAEVTVGVYVRCAGKGAGAWGKIDDAMLNSVP